MDRNLPLGAGLAAGTLAELMLGGVRSPVLWGAGLLAASVTAARGRFPFAAPVVVVVAFASPVLTVGRQLPGLGDGPHSWSLTIVWLLAAYTLGTPRDLRVAGLGLLLFGGLSALYVLGPGSPSGASASDLLAALLFSTGVPWLAGVAVGRQRRARAADRLREDDRIHAAIERTRLARDVHDLVAHSVSLMVVQAEAAEALLPSAPERSAESLRAVQDAGRRALSELRRTVAALRAGNQWQEERQDLSALPELLDTVRSAGLPIALVIDGEMVPVPAEVERSGYRLVREGLTNALRHSDRTGVMVTLRYAADRLEVAVVDQGRPVRRRLPGGHGMTGMRELVGDLGGTFDSGPAVDGRHVLHAVLPLHGTA